MAQTKYVPPAKTEDKNYINGLTDGRAWGSSYGTYGFPTAKAQYGAGYPEATTFKPLTAGQQKSARDTIANYNDVSGLNFFELGGAGATAATARYGYSDRPVTAYAYDPSTSARGGDVWFGNKNGFVADPLPGGYTHFTTLHETGHATGLKHTDEGRVHLPRDHDSIENTVMSYRTYTGQPAEGNYTVGSGSYPQTLMRDDIRALQHLYGPDYGTNAGNTTYRWDPNTGEMSINGQPQGKPMANKIFRTIWDGGGNDTYDASNYTTPVKINLEPGQWSTLAPNQVADLGSNRKPPGSVANAYLHKNNPASLIENAIGGSGNDTFVPNAASNRIDGGPGIDTVIYAGRKADYTITKMGDHFWSVSGPKTGTDILANVETLVFDDGQVPLDTA